MSTKIYLEIDYIGNHLKESIKFLNSTSLRLLILRVSQY